ncbi:MAG TPA: transporter [Leptospiraceae bacterium]|nr:transporter [Leptospiraceae bacterium]HMY65825.1 transporter [Leptospiraceae bacterium]HNF27014.1 transporter [Leptospiraceae bacterium]HNM03073.1 transporter [Leptospiraceae bacterium]HNN05007.1 transporter [Leptospiraceae bacterium]
MKYIIFYIICSFCFTAYSQELHKHPVPKEKKRGAKKLSELSGKALEKNEQPESEKNSETNNAAESQELKPEKTGEDTVPVSEDKSVPRKDIKTDPADQTEHHHSDSKEHSHSQEPVSHSHGKVLGMPAGLMVPHIHGSKEWMIDYMYMSMDMNEMYVGGKAQDPSKYLIGLQPNYSLSVSGSSGVHNHSGTTSSSSDASPLPSLYAPVLNASPYRYMSVPQKMKMEMTMLSVMKNITDKFSVMIMIPYVNNSMKMLLGNYESSFMRVQGVGDVSVTGVFQFFRKDSHRINLQFGISLPTGSIDEKNLMPLMGESRSPYNMQPGSGTYNTIPGIAYLFSNGKWNAGSFTQVLLRNAKNSNGYRFGNRYESSIWISYSFWEWAAPILRVTYSKWDNISGADSALDYKMDPQNDPNLQGGRRMDILAGMNFTLPSVSEKLKAGLEFGKPVYQHLNGPQMGATTLFNFRLQYMF